MTWLTNIRQILNISSGYNDLDSEISKKIASNMKNIRLDKQLNQVFIEQLDVLPNPEAKEEAEKWGQARL